MGTERHYPPRGRCVGWGLERSHPIPIDGEIPENARKYLTRTNEGWLFDPGDVRIHPATWAAAATGITASVPFIGLACTLSMIDAGLVYPIWMAAGALFALLFLVACAVSLVLWVRAQRPRQIRLTPAGIFNLPRKEDVRPTQVTLAGEPGKLIRIDAGVRLVTAYPSTLLDPTGWSYDSLVWFGEALARLWKVPLHNELEETTWRRWLEDPGFRRTYTFDNILRQSQAQHASWHQMPEAAVNAKYTHHGVQVGETSIRNGEVRYRQVCVALTAIERVEAVFRTAGPVAYGAVLLQVNDGRDTLKVAKRVLRAPSEASELQGLASLVRTHAAKAAPGDVGSEEEVPAALKALRAPERLQ